LPPPPTYSNREQAVYDPAPVAFTTYPLSPPLLQGLKELGYLETRAVQSAVIPYA
jgi:superfamily II DNA/RNA helicase